MLILPKLIYRFKAIKIPAGSFVAIDKIILKCVQRDYGTRIAKKPF